MWLKLLSRSLATLLVISLFFAVMGYVLNGTLFNTAFLKAKLTQTNSYSKLSSAIATELGNSPDTDSAVKEQLHTLLTPAVVEQKLNTTLDQFDAYFKHDGPAPTLDMRDIAAQAQAAGVQVPADSNLNQPIKLIDAKNNARDVAQKSRTAGMVALGAMVVIAAALVAICVRRKDYRPLANVVIALGIWLFVTAGTLALARNALAEKLTQQGGDNALQSALRDLGAAITNDIMVQLAIISVVTLVVGIVARIVIGKAQGKRTYSVKRANT